MIKYNLVCKCTCTFDSWFASSEEFERLMKKGMLTCVECNSNNIGKSIMAPNVSNTKKNLNENYQLKKNIKNKIVEYQKFIKENCEYVGDNFANEARSIHYGKEKINGIYGKATEEELTELEEEGISTTTIPWYDRTEN